jgi:glutathione synthase/RimK-type ligase-like ATP-grasp enzyme
VHTHASPLPLCTSHITIADAIKLDKNMKYNLSSVGWDIIISQDGPYFLEGNMCHGIVRKKDIYYYEKIQEFIQKLIRLISLILI